MHKYLRAVGFSEVKNREQLQKLIGEVVTKTVVHLEKEENGCKATRDIVVDEENRIYAELCLDFSPEVGLCVRGEYDEENVFLYEYYFPYIKGRYISSNENITVERLAEKEAYAGVCDDIKVGVSLIFYLQNMIEYKRYKAKELLPVKGTRLLLSGLSIDGKIMMPINKNEKEKEKLRKASIERNQLIEQARRGDEQAIESLTLDDMDTYTTISRKIQKEDVFSLVDTYFMPYGVECDQYSVLGEITEVNHQKNRLTGEELIVMNIECNELSFDVCINKKDLFGEPEVGRRFKGVVWLQGTIDYPSLQ